MKNMKSPKKNLIEKNKTIYKIFKSLQKMENLQKY